MVVGNRNPGWHITNATTTTTRDQHSLTRHHRHPPRSFHYAKQPQNVTYSTQWPVIFSAYILTYWHWHWMDNQWANGDRDLWDWELRNSKWEWKCRMLKKTGCQWLSGNIVAVAAVEVSGGGGKKIRATNQELELVLGNDLIGNATCHIPLHIQSYSTMHVPSHTSHSEHSPLAFVFQVLLFSQKFSVSMFCFVLWIVNVNVNCELGLWNLNLELAACGLRVQPCGFAFAGWGCGCGVAWRLRVAVAVALRYLQTQILI